MSERNSYAGQKPMGKPAGKKVGEWKGKAAGSPEGKTAGKAVGKAAGMIERKAAGKVAGKTTGKSYGEAAGKAVGKAAGMAERKTAGGAVGKITGKSAEYTPGKLGRKQFSYNEDRQAYNAGRPEGTKDGTRLKEINYRDTGKAAGMRRNQPTDMAGKQTARRAVAKGGCPYIRECGSCNMLQSSYETHLSEKQKRVDSMIKKFCRVEPIIGMENPKHYRNKVHVVFDHDRKGNPISGIYEEGTHHIKPIDYCLIHNQKADEIISTIRGMLKSFKILTYDEDSGYGLLRHVLVRTGFHSGEIMVVLVLASPILPSKSNFVKALRKVHPEITTIVVNVNDKKTSMILGDKEQVVYGKGFIEDTLCSKVFRISPKSFYQVNPMQTEVLYKKAIELAELNGNETVIDAYCGIGTIGLIASDHVKRVIGVELNKDAVRDAVINAKRNESTNVEFYNNDAGVFLTQVADKNESIDLVIMDPPRSGSTEEFLDAVARLKPKKVIYISCNPITLERDLLYLTKKGYKANVAVPVDMFPWTEHVEMVVLISRVVK